MIYKDDAGNCWVLAPPGSLSTSTVFWYWGETSHFHNTLDIKGFK